MSSEVAPEVLVEITRASLAANALADSLDRLAELGIGQHARGYRVLRCEALKAAYYLAEMRYELTRSPP